MGSYLGIIKEAILIFPFVALVISVPFILSQYHRYGSLSFFTALVIYSLVLYLMCAYFLVILPLPTQQEVAAMTSPRMSLIPLQFVVDFIKDNHVAFSGLKSIVRFILQPCVYVPLYNIFLTMPFGFYLNYYFQKNWKQAIIISLLLSLFFELTQLSGLYFIYPRGYRLFDVDDLLLNTLGGLIGYLLCKPLLKYLPKKETIHKKAYERGMIISGFRKFVSFMMDVFFFMCFTVTFSFFISFTNSAIYAFVLYYIVSAFIFGGGTLSERFLNVKIVDKNGKNNLFKLGFRRLLFVLFYVIIPLGVGRVTIDLIKEFGQTKIQVYMIAIIGGSILFMIYGTSIVKYLFVRKELLYEKLSGTKMISTITMPTEQAQQEVIEDGEQDNNTTEND